MKTRTVTTHYVDWRDLEEYIKDTYGMPFDVVASEEGSNDSSMVIDVDGQLSEYDLAGFEDWLAGHWLSYGTRTMLNKLCKDEKIPAGRYVVEVSW